MAFTFPFTSPRQRAHYGDFASDNSIEFQVLEMDAADDYEDPADRSGPYAFRIHLFGVTRSGQSICCLVNGFHPFFYIKIPDTWTDNDVYGYLSTVKASIDDLRRQKWFDIHDRETVGRTTSKDLWGFRNGTMYSFIQLRFSTRNQYHTVLNAAKKAPSPMGQDNPLEPHHIFEGSVDPFLKFIHNRDFKSWVRVQRPEIAASASIHTTLKVTADYTDILSIESDDVAPCLQCSVDIETYSSTGAFPKPEVKEDVVFMVASVFKVYGDKEFRLKHCIVMGDYEPWEGQDVIVTKVDTEQDLLLCWASLIRYMDPDIIISYNGDWFDFHYLHTKAKLLGIESVFVSLLTRLDWERKYATLEHRVFQSAAFGKSEFRRLNIPGRINFDLYLWARKELKLESYKLDSVAETLIGEKKNDMPVQRIFDAWKSKDVALMTEVLRYCVQDTLLPQKIIDKRSIIPNLIEMSKATFVPIRYLLHRGQQIKVFSQILKLTRSLNYRIPDIGPEEEVDEEEDGDDSEGETRKRKAPPSAKSKKKFEGATVLAPEKGAYWKPIATLDFASLYPSIIRAHSLCYTTLVLDPQFANVPGAEYIEIVVDTERFRFAQGTECILPKLLSDLAVMRKQTRKVLATVDDEKEPIKAVVLDAKQLAYKISMNSVYGFLAANMLPLKQIGACVTASGRSMILATKEKVEKDYPPAVVIYGDTDSVFVDFKRPDLDLKGLFELAHVCASNVTTIFESPIELEFEKIYWPLILLMKKKYIGNMYTAVDKPPKIDKKGVSSKRRDYCAFLRDLMDEICKILMAGRGKTVSQVYLQCVGCLDKHLNLLLEGGVPLDKLGITKTLKDGYTNSKTLPAHAQVAERMKKRGQQVKSNDKITYIVLAPKPGTSANDSISHRCEDIAHVREHDLDIDKLYYISNQVKSQITQLVAPLWKGDKAVNIESVLFGKYEVRARAQLTKKRRSEFFLPRK